MSVEQTIKFILETQARAEARADRADARMDRADARMGRMEKKPDGKWQPFGSCCVREWGRSLRMAEAQKQINRGLKAFIKSLRNGGRSNGS